MKTSTALGGIAILVLIVGGAVLSGILDPDYDTSAVDAQNQVPDQQLLAHGKYLAQAGDCAACHTTKDGPRLPAVWRFLRPLEPFTAPI